MKTKAVVEVGYPSTISAGKKGHACVMRFTGDSHGLLETVFAPLHIYRSLDVNDGVVFPRFARLSGDVLQSFILINGGISDRSVHACNRKCRHLPCAIAL